jgi:DNA-binding LacI/PurR family transcriptional regulator
MPPAPRISLQQVAERAGVSISTASRCLREDPRFSKATHAKVKAAAEALAYQPDPMLRALVAYRTQQKRSIVRAEIAWLHPYKGGLKKAPVPRHRLLSMFKGALQRAGELGYRLVEFSLPDEAALPAVQRILSARGIEGAVLCTVRQSPACAGLDFRHMAVISIGYTLDHLGFPSITPHYFRGALRALDELRLRSSRRIGLALFDNADAHADHLIRAAFTYKRDVHPETEWLPAFVEPGRLRHCTKAFSEWFLTHKPDAILTNEWLIISQILKLGYSVPGDVSVALTDTAHPLALGSGIYENAHVLGACAINQLAGMIQHRDFGLSGTMQHTFVENAWLEGRTVRPLTRVSPEERKQRAEEQQTLAGLQVPELPRKSFAHHLPDIGFGYGVPAPVKIHG